MAFSLLWLPEVLESAGLKVAETPDWRTRGRAEMGAVRGVMCHHTATSKQAAGNMPTLGLLINGRAAGPGAAALAGPLAQLGLGRDGTYYVVAAGRANHAGAGQWQGFVDTGNSSFIGIEAENSGLDDDPWPEIQMDAYTRGAAAILKHIGAGASLCCGHKEYATPPGRKIDPSLDMAVFRTRVAAILAGATTRPLIAASDGAQRPTLRRGASGDDVSKLQAALGSTPTGAFDGATEAKLRLVQTEHNLVPDGIAGPATWKALVPQADPAAPPTQINRNLAPASSAALPPADDTGAGVTVQGMFAVTPDGRHFATRSGPGFITTGVTPLADWLAGPDGAALSLSPSRTRVVRAMCVNEGGLEAINTYDSCFLSFGIFQWTAGADAASGELPALLQRLQQTDPQAFTECFGITGLGVQMDPDGLTGDLTLHGAPLRSAAEKATLRTAIWAYRFWRAGHHPAMRLCELSHAAARLSRFESKPAAGQPIKAWLSSELGMALVLDEHVNRPGHVPSTLEQALASIAPPLPADPAEWTIADEQALILAYLDARRSTSMTDSDKRAGRITAFVPKGELSEARGSYSA